MLPIVSDEVAGQVSRMMSDTGKATDRERGEMFLRGAMYVWEALRVQDEVNDMNDQWGL